MLLYEYPPKLDRKGKQLKAVHDLEEHKKFQKNIYRNLILGIVIVVLGMLVPLAVLKIAVMLIGFCNIGMAFLLSRYSAMSRDTNCYTRIFDDRLEHKQGSLISKNYTSVVLYYADILKSEQTPSGRLTVWLKEGHGLQLKQDKPTRNVENELKEGKITLNFQDTRAKLYLIENLHEEIKYPKKQYNVIEDEEDEDDLWDPLHKHGL